MTKASPVLNEKQTPQLTQHTRPGARGDPPSCGLPRSPRSPHHTLPTAPVAGTFRPSPELSVPPPGALPLRSLPQLEASCCAQSPPPGRAPDVSPQDSTKTPVTGAGSRCSRAPTRAPGPSATRFTAVCTRTRTLLGPGCAFPTPREPRAAGGHPSVEA